MDIDMQQQPPPDMDFESMTLDDLSSVPFAGSCTCPCTCSAHRNMDADSFAMIEGSEGAEAQPFILVLPEEECKILSSTKAGGEVPLAVGHRSEESESMTKLKANIHKLERALHHAHIRPSPPPDLHAYDDVAPEVKMLSRDIIVAGGGSVHCERTVKPQGNSNRSCSSRSLESDRLPSYHQVSVRRTTSTRNTEDLTQDLKSVLSTDSLQFRLKDDGTGAYVIKIGKGVLKQYGSLEICPSALTLTLRK